MDGNGHHGVREPGPFRDPASTLILGVGNVLHRDDGAGVRVVEAMAKMESRGDVEFLGGVMEGFDVVDAIANRRKLIVVDAMYAGAAPGTVRRLTVADLCRDHSGALGLHDFGLVEGLRVAERLGCAPREVVVFGVQPGDVSVGSDLSGAVSSAVPGLIQRLLRELPPIPVDCLWATA